MDVKICFSDGEFFVISGDNLKVETMKTGERIALRKAIKEKLDELNRTPIDKLGQIRKTEGPTNPLRPDPAALVATIERLTKENDDMAEKLEAAEITSLRRLDKWGKAERKVVNLQKELAELKADTVKCACGREYRRVFFVGTPRTGDMLCAISQSEYDALIAERDLWKRKVDAVRHHQWSPAFHSGYGIKDTIIDIIEATK